MLVLARVEAPQCHEDCLRPHVELPTDDFVGEVMFVPHDPDSLHVVVIDFLVVPLRRLLLLDPVLSDSRALLKKCL